MIQPSQRISAKETPRDPFSLHGNYAKKRYWHLRLLYCAVTATVVSFVAYLLQVPWLWHGLLLVLGFGLGFIVPVRTVGEWALGFIERQIGFSYRTALEYPDSDSYGFGQAVKARAARFSRSLAAPQLQPWWLPLMVLALVFMILPQLNFAPQGGAAGGPPTNPITPQTNPPPPELGSEESGDPELDTDQEQSQEEEEQSPEEALEENRIPDDSENFDTPGNSSSQAEGNRPVDSETLDRFLENLSELPPEVEEERPENTAPDRQQGTNGNPEQRSEADRLEEGEGQEGEQGESSDQGQQEGQQGEEGQNGQDGEQAEGEQQGEGDEGQDQGQQGQDEQAGASDPDGSQDQGQGSAGPEGEEGLQEASEGDPGDGAGSSPSAALPTEIMEEVNQNDPELIEGRLQRGPSTVAGEIRMPGSQELDLQSGNVQEDYRQALERAVSEGRIPVEYQEILRNYFR